MNFQSKHTNADSPRSRSNAIRNAAPLCPLSPFLCYSLPPSSTSNHNSVSQSFRLVILEAYYICSFVQPLFLCYIYEILHVAVVHLFSLLYRMQLCKYAKVYYPLMKWHWVVLSLGLFPEMLLWTLFYMHFRDYVLIFVFISRSE